MSNLLKNLAQKTQTTIGQAVEYVKDKVTTIAGTHSVTVQQLVDYIIHQSDTKLEKKELLGLSFSFYQLERDGIHYYVEMKGSYILQVDIHTVDHMISSYRSYRDAPNVLIRVPESLL
jgi:hypothetical protein